MRRYDEESDEESSSSSSSDSDSMDSADDDDDESDHPSDDDDDSAASSRRRAPVDYSEGAASRPPASYGVEALPLGSQAAHSSRRRAPVDYSEGTASPATRMNTPTGRSRGSRIRTIPTASGGGAAGGKQARPSSASPFASTGLGIDDAVLLMVSSVFNGMNDRYATVISNDKFRDYPGQRVSYDEIIYENLRTDPRSPTPREPRRLREIPLVRDGFGFPSTRMISGPGDFEDQYILNRVNMKTRVVNRRAEKRIEIKKEGAGWKNIRFSKDFLGTCMAMLMKKIRTAGTAGVVERTIGQQVLENFRNEVIGLAERILNSARGDIYYLVDVENLFNRQNFDTYEDGLRSILPQLDMYFRRRWRGDLLWGYDPRTGELIFRGLNHPDMRGKRIQLVFPVFKNRIGAFNYQLRQTMAYYRDSLGIDFVFDIRVVPYSIDFFNTLSRGTSQGSRGASRGSRGAGGRAPKRQRRSLVDLNNLLIKLRF